MGLAAASKIMCVEGGAASGRSEIAAPLAVEVVEVVEMMMEAIAENHHSRSPIGPRAPVGIGVSVIGII
jgi:hypothetical protein